MLWDSKELQVQYSMLGSSTNRSICKPVATSASGAASGLRQDLSIARTAVRMSRGSISSLWSSTFGAGSAGGGLELGPAVPSPSTNCALMGLADAFPSAGCWRLLHWQSLAPSKGQVFATTWPEGQADPRRNHRPLLWTPFSADWLSACTSGSGMPWPGASPGLSACSPTLPPPSVSRCSRNCSSSEGRCELVTVSVMVSLSDSISFVVLFSACNLLSTASRKAWTRAFRWSTWVCSTFCDRLSTTAERFSLRCSVTVTSAFCRTESRMAWSCFCNSSKAALSAFCSKVLLSFSTSTFN
mmetsp:Transcript_74153/g.239810  ORF Transcript_74153/g.239810 Transcript_74153/m.239810 type:complete len:299 (+) Transcript_74153:591-1487(+)